MERMDIVKDILVVEDEEQVLDVISKYLSNEGYNVDCALNGDKALELFDKNKYKLVILDLMLPDISGEDICKAMRRASDVYIFMLTAKTALNDKIEGFNAGADEYLIKPFSPRELTARVNALFRRIGLKEETLTFNNGNLKINCENRTVKVNNNLITLTPNEYDILLCLAKNKDRVLSREMIIERVFGLDFDGSDRNIDVHIKNIRKKIEGDSKLPRYIVTVTKIGYKFVGDA